MRNYEQCQGTVLSLCRLCCDVVLGQQDVPLVAILVAHSLPTVVVQKAALAVGWPVGWHLADIDDVALVKPVWLMFQLRGVVCDSMVWLNCCCPL